MSRRRSVARGAASSIPLILLWISHVWPPNTLDAQGLHSILLTLTSVLIAVTLALIGLSTGLTLMRRFRVGGLSSLESHLYALTIGLGVEMSLVLFLGLVGLLYEWLIAFLLSTLLFLTWSDLSDWLRSLPSLFERTTRQFRTASRWTKLMVILGLLVLAAAFLGALAPPVDYDGLMYHLTAPRAFLAAHRIFPDFDNWWHNYPLAVQMLYLGCLAFRSDIAAKLLNMCLGAVFVMTCVATARRALPGKETWINAAAVLGIPVLAVWGSAAYADLGNAAFVGLAFLAVLIWLELHIDSLLILAGVEIGLALSSKYTSLIDLAFLGVFLMWSARRLPAKTILRALILYAAPAVLIASAWYIKNWIWLGSPFFPVPLFPGTEPSLRYELNAGYLQHGIGAGRSILDYLLLPFRVYTDSLQFGQFPLEMPSLVFPALILWLSVPGSTSKLFLGLGASRFLLWVLSSQANRFLIPSYIYLCIATAQAASNSRLVRRPLPGFFVRSLISGMAAVAVAVGLARVASSLPWRPVLGVESRREFLQRSLAGFPTREYIRQHLSRDALVFLVGDGRRYYCPSQCIREVDQFAWTRITIEADMQTDKAVSLMCSQGVTHVLLSWPDINYLLLHDWDGKFTSSIRFLITEFEPAKLRLVFREPDASLYSIDCNPNARVSKPSEEPPIPMSEVTLRSHTFNESGTSLPREVSHVGLPFNDWRRLGHSAGPSNRTPFSPARPVLDHWP